MVSSPIENNSFKHWKAWRECWFTPWSYYRSKLLNKIITSFFNRVPLVISPGSLSSDSISSTKPCCGTLTQRMTTGIPTEPFTRGRSSMTNLLSLRHCIELVPLICHAQTQGQRWKEWEMWQDYLRPQIAEVSCQKNSGKNDQMVCQAQTQKDENQKESVSSFYDHKEALEEDNKKKARKRKHVCVHGWSTCHGVRC